MPMPLVAETDNNAGAPARSAPSSVPDAMRGRFAWKRATDRSAQWLHSSHSYMPCGRDLRPR
eukprot:2073510-Pyramimonas_sp.AAC.1